MSRIGILAAAAAMICCLTLCGCTGETESDRAEVYPAEGTVAVDGLPAAGVLLVLHPTEGSPADRAGVKPSATTDVDGTFRLSTYGQNDGAPAGEYAVTVQWYQNPSKRKPGPGMVPGFAPPVDYFQGKYNDPDSSPWHITIIEGENVLQPIDVE